MNQPVSHQTTQALRNGFTGKLWERLCSLRLASTPLVLLAFTSILGAFIEQGKTPGGMAAKHGWNLDFLRFLDKSINAFDRYHSWWFLSLVGIFAVSLICCSIKRFRHVCKTVNQPKLIGDDSLFRTLSNVEEVVVRKGSVDEVRQKAGAFLGAKCGGDFVFSLLDFNQREYTGVQVAKDSGVLVVFLMVIGSCGAFFPPPRRLLLTIQPLNKGTASSRATAPTATSRPSHSFSTA